MKTPRKTPITSSSERYVIVTTTGPIIESEFAERTGRLAVGIAYACCDDRCLNERAVFVGEVQLMGQLIADVMDYAERRGLRAALTAAIDQGLANAREVTR